jgi:hypothetical protein
MMRTANRHNVALGLASAVIAWMLMCAPTIAAASSRNGETLSPLPPSNYSVQSVCGQPSYGEATCMAMELVPETHAARQHSHPIGMTITAAASPDATKPCEPPTAAEGCFGLRPVDLHEAYDLPETPTSAQTIALVDAYDDPTAAADLKAYDEEYGLQPCAPGSCFKQVNQKGEEGNPSFPKTSLELKEARESSEAAKKKDAAEAEGWTVETSLDIETAHAVCDTCTIVLVEAESPSIANLETAEQTAVSLGANEISNSWGGTECVEEDHVQECLPDSSAFDHSGIVITASAGDSGYDNWDSNYPGFANFPASSPHVVAVGGTRLQLTAQGTWQSESVWNGDGAGGGGCSESFTAPGWQQRLSDWAQVGCSDERSVADVAADADPYTGLAVYDTSSTKCKSIYEEESGEEVVIEGWCTIGGTSLASPLIASVYALAGGGHGIEFPAHTLYANETADPHALHDITEGSNGICDEPFSGEGLSGCTAVEEAEASCTLRLTCMAASGYDGPTGVGTPDGIEAFVPPPGGEEESGGSSGGSGGRTRGALETSASLPPAGSGDTGLLTQDASTTTNGGPPAPPTVRLSELALTHKALVALNTDRPRIPQLTFSFWSNELTTVRVALQKLARKHGHDRWQAFGSSFPVAVATGQNLQGLNGRGVLKAGFYRVLLTPVGGAAHSLDFRIG